MSCNHVYHDEHSDDSSCDSSDENGIISDEQNGSDVIEAINHGDGYSSLTTFDDPETEMLLEHVGMLTPAPLIAALWSTLKLLNGKAECISENEVTEAHGLTSAEEFLERDFCLIEPLLAVVLAAFAKVKSKSPTFTKVKSKSPSFVNDEFLTQRGNSNEFNKNAVSQQDSCNPPFSQEVPTDALVQIMSYLHPRDVVQFACVSQSCRNFVDKGHSSSALWKSLWERDYGWIIYSWDVGQRAFQRSININSEILASSSSLKSQSSSRSSSFRIPFGKEFYFNFGQAYMNYTLAGCNRTDKCLVGLHGCIYDITDFIPSHPGSPETLLVVGGGDATYFFEDVNHTVSARRLAKSLCVVVDRPCALSEHSHGLFPTKNTVLLPNSSSASVPAIMESESITLSRQQYIRQEYKIHGSLHTTRTHFAAERCKQEKLFNRKLSRLRSQILGSVKIYYDPFCSQWKAWYTDTSFETVFVD